MGMWKAVAGFFVLLAICLLIYAGINAVEYIKTHTDIVVLTAVIVILVILIIVNLIKKRRL